METALIFLSNGRTERTLSLANSTLYVLPLILCSSGKADLWSCQIQIHCQNSATAIFGHCRNNFHLKLGKNSRMVARKSTPMAPTYFIHRTISEDNFMHLVQKFYIMMFTDPTLYECSVQIAYCALVQCDPNSASDKRTIYFKNIIITAGAGTNCHILLGRHPSA